MTKSLNEIQRSKPNDLSSTTPLVEITDLRKSFFHSGKRIDVLRGIDFTLAHGEMISVMGMSGVGKSTFLQILGTLDIPSSGRVLFDGINIFSLSPQKLALFRNQSIGFVFQFHHLLPDFSALENVMMPCLIARLSRKEARQKAEELLTEIGLGHRLENPPSKLSGGEQQRVSLARALVMEPRLVLADEPTGNLDRATSEEIHRLFARMNERKGIAMVLVTHNPSLASIASRCLQMVDGRILEKPLDVVEKNASSPESSSPSLAQSAIPNVEESKENKKAPTDFSEIESNGEDKSKKTSVEILSSRPEKSVANESS